MVACKSELYTFLYSVAQKAEFYRYDSPQILSQTYRETCTGRPPPYQQRVQKLNRNYPCCAMGYTNQCQWQYRLFRLELLFLSSRAEQRSLAVRHRLVFGLIQRFDLDHIQRRHRYSMCTVKFLTGRMVRTFPFAQ